MRLEHTHIHYTTLTTQGSSLALVYKLVEFRRSLGVIESPELLGGSSMGSSLVLSCNSRSFVIELDYGYRYLLEVYSELSDICFMIWLHYHSMLALHDRPVIAMVNILALELWQLFQYSYVCSNVMSVHPKVGGFARDTRVSLANVDMVFRLVKCCWMTPFPTVCRGNRKVVIALSVPSNPPCFDWKVGGALSCMVGRASPVSYRSSLPIVPI